MLYTGSAYSRCLNLLAVMYYIISHQEAYDIRVILSISAKFDCWLRSQLPNLPISVIFPLVISLWSDSLWDYQNVCSLYLSLHPWSLPELQHWGLQMVIFYLCHSFYIYWLIFFVNRIISSSVCVSFIVSPCLFSFWNDIDSCSFFNSVCNIAHYHHLPFLVLRLLQVWPRRVPSGQTLCCVVFCLNWDKNHI